VDQLYEIKVPESVMLYKEYSMSYIIQRTLADSFAETSIGFEVVTKCPLIRSSTQHNSTCGRA